MSATVAKGTDRIFELQHENRAAMAALRRSTGERFYQESEHRLNCSQCYRALLQCNDEAVTKMDHSIRFLPGESAVTRSKIDFIIGRMQDAYMEEGRAAQEGTGGNDTAGNSIPRETTTHGGPSLGFHDKRSPYLFLNDFQRDLQELESKIT